MKNNKYRLYFVDAMRAWAILMMLQGHFVDGLLDPIYRDSSNMVFGIWQYFRGVTAPVFFTVSGFIFTYLLIKGTETGWDNPRVKKGIKRGLQLLFIGYLLRTNLFGLLNGEIYGSFYLVDVLHCIGLSLLGIVGIYLFSSGKRKFVFPLVLLVTTLVLFVLEPQYKTMGHTYLPEFLANYLTKVNGSVFTIFPWFGYATFGSFLALMFARFKDFKYLYPSAISIAFAMGYLLIAQSSNLVLWLSQTTGSKLFADLYLNNFLLHRLGDVFVVFGLFMLMRRFMTNKTVLSIGSSTLSIYVVHYMILYGSLTGLGLYAFLHHSLPPSIIVPGAIAFMIACTYGALRYERNKADIKLKLSEIRQLVAGQLESWSLFSLRAVKEFAFRLWIAVLRLLRVVKN
tara:strand:+ start:14496 stop:15692 length:1197 start_codon:yes stop_codon:yes gene_type:complete